MKTKIIIILLCLVTQVLQTNGLKQLKNSLAKSDSPLLKKILELVDDAINDEHLLQITLKLLRSLCICMRETLKAKEDNLKIDQHPLELNEHSGTEGKVFDLYKNIYNNTCFNLRQDLTNHTYKFIVDEEDEFLNHTNCGKDERNEALDTRDHSDDKSPAVKRSIPSRLEQVLYNTLILTKDLHEYRLRKYNPFGKGTPQTKGALQDILIVILTLYPEKHELFLTSNNIDENDLNNTIHTKSPIDIDLIGTEFAQKSKEQDGSIKADIVTECNLQSLYILLTESDRNNLMKVFKFIRKRNTVKIYIEVKTEKKHTDLINICCDNGTKYLQCNKHLINNFVTQPKFIDENYKNTITKIRKLVHQYENNLNDTTHHNTSAIVEDEMKEENTIIKPTTMQTGSSTDHINEIGIPVSVTNSQDSSKLGEVTQAIVLLNDFVAKQPTKTYSQIETTDSAQEYYVFKQKQHEDITTIDIGTALDTKDHDDIFKMESTSSMPLNKNNRTENTGNYLPENVEKLTTSFKHEQSISKKDIIEPLDVTLPIFHDKNETQTELQHASEYLINTLSTVNFVAKNNDLSTDLYTVENMVNITTVRQANITVAATLNNLDKLLEFTTPLPTTERTLMPDLRIHQSKVTDYKPYFLGQRTKVGDSSSTTISTRDQNNSTPLYYSPGINLVSLTNNKTLPPTLIFGHSLYGAAKILNDAKNILEMLNHVNATDVTKSIAESEYTNIASATEQSKPSISNVIVNVISMTKNGNEIGQNVTLGESILNDVVKQPETKAFTSKFLEPKNISETTTNTIFQKIAPNTTHQQLPTLSTMVYTESFKQLFPGHMENNIIERETMAGLKSTPASYERIETPNELIETSTFTIESLETMNVSVSTMKSIFPNITTKTTPEFLATHPSFEFSNSDSHVFSDNMDDIHSTDIVTEAEPLRTVTSDLTELDGLLTQTEIKSSISEPLATTNTLGTTVRTMSQSTVSNVTHESLATLFTFDFTKLQSQSFYDRIEEINTTDIVTKAETKNPFTSHTVVDEQPETKTITPESLGRNNVSETTENEIFLKIAANMTLESLITPDFEVDVSSVFTNKPVVAEGTVFATLQNITDNEIIMKSTKQATLEEEIKMTTNSIKKKPNIVNTTFQETFYYTNASTKTNTQVVMTTVLPMDTEKTTIVAEDSNFIWLEDVSNNHINIGKTEPSTLEKNLTMTTDFGRKDVHKNSYPKFPAAIITKNVQNIDRILQSEAISTSNPPKTELLETASSTDSYTKIAREAYTIVTTTSNQPSQKISIPKITSESIQITKDFENLMSEAVSTETVFDKTDFNFDESNNGLTNYLERPEIQSTDMSTLNEYLVIKSNESSVTREPGNNEKDRHFENTSIVHETTICANEGMASEMQEINNPTTKIQVIKHSGPSKLDEKTSVQKEMETEVTVSFNGIFEVTTDSEINGISNEAPKNNMKVFPPEELVDGKRESLSKYLVSTEMTPTDVPEFTREYVTVTEENLFVEHYVTSTSHTETSTTSENITNQQTTDTFIDLNSTSHFTNELNNTDDMEVTSLGITIQDRTDESLTIPTSTKAVESLLESITHSSFNLEDMASVPVIRTTKHENMLTDNIILQTLTSSPTTIETSTYFENNGASLTLGNEFSTENNSLTDATKEVYTINNLREIIQDKSITDLKTEPILTTAKKASLLDTLNENKAPFSQTSSNHVNTKEAFTTESETIKLMNDKNVARIKESILPTSEIAISDIMQNTTNNQFTISNVNAVQISENPHPETTQYTSGLILSASEVTKTEDIAYLKDILTGTITPLPGFMSQRFTSDNSPDDEILSSIKLRQTKESVKMQFYSDETNITPVSDITKSIININNENASTDSFFTTTTANEPLSSDVMQSTSKMFQNTKSVSTESNKILTDKPKFKRLKTLKDKIKSKKPVAFELNIRVGVEANQGGIKFSVLDEKETVIHEKSESTLPHSTYFTLNQSADNDIKRKLLKPEIKSANVIKKNKTNSFTNENMNITKSSDIVNNGDLSHITEILKKLSWDLPVNKKRQKKLKSPQHSKTRKSFGDNTTIDENIKRHDINSTSYNATITSLQNNFTHIKHKSMKPGVLTEKLDIYNLSSIYKEQYEKLNKSMNFTDSGNLNAINVIKKAMLSLPESENMGLNTTRVNNTLKKNESMEHIATSSGTLLSTKKNLTKIEPRFKNEISRTSKLVAKKLEIVLKKLLKGKNISKHQLLILKTKLLKNLTSKKNYTNVHKHHVSVKQKNNVNMTNDTVTPYKTCNSTTSSANNITGIQKLKATSDRKMTNNETDSFKKNTTLNTVKIENGITEQTVVEELFNTTSKNILSARRLFATLCNNSLSSLELEQSSFNCNPETICQNNTCTETNSSKNMKANTSYEEPFLSDMILSEMDDDLLKTKNESIQKPRETLSDDNNNSNIVLSVIEDFNYNNLMEELNVKTLKQQNNINTSSFNGVNLAANNRTKDIANDDTSTTVTDTDNATVITNTNNNNSATRYDTSENIFTIPTQTTFAFYVTSPSLKEEKFKNVAQNEFNNGEQESTLTVPRTVKSNTAVNFPLTITNVAPQINESNNNIRQDIHEVMANIHDTKHYFIDDIFDETPGQSARSGEIEVYRRAENLKNKRTSVQVHDVLSTPLTLTEKGQSLIVIEKTRHKKKRGNIDDISITEHDLNNFNDKSITTNFYNESTLIGEGLGITEQMFNGFSTALPEAQFLSINKNISAENNVTGTTDIFKHMTYSGVSTKTLNKEKYKETESLNKSISKLTNKVVDNFIITNASTSTKPSNTSKNFGEEIISSLRKKMRDEFNTSSAIIHDLNITTQRPIEEKKDNQPIFMSTYLTTGDYEEKSTEIPDVPASKLPLTEISSKILKIEDVNEGRVCDKQTINTITALNTTTVKNTEKQHLFTITTDLPEKNISSEKILTTHQERLLPEIKFGIVSATGSTDLPFISTFGNISSIIPNLNLINPNTGQKVLSQSTENKDDPTSVNYKKFVDSVTETNEISNKSTPITTQFVIAVTNAWTHADKTSDKEIKEHERILKTQLREANNTEPLHLADESGSANKSEIRNKTISYKNNEYDKPDFITSSSQDKTTRNTTKNPVFLKVHDGEKNETDIGASQLSSFKHYHLNVTKMIPVNKTKVNVKPEVQKLVLVSNNKSKSRTDQTNRNGSIGNYTSLFPNVRSGNFKSKKGIEIFSSRLNRQHNSPTTTACTKNIKYNTYRPITKEELEILKYFSDPILNTVLHKQINDVTPSQKAAIDNSSTASESVYSRSQLDKPKTILRAGNSSEAKQKTRAENQDRAGKDIHLGMNDKLNQSLEISITPHSSEISRISHPILEININSPQIRTNGNLPPMIEINGNPLPIEINRNLVPMAVNGNSMSMDINGNPLPMRMNGNSGPMALNGNAGSMGMKGNSAPMSINGCSAPMAMYGNSAPMAMTGNSAPMAISGNSATMAMTGNSAAIAMNGNSAPMAINRNSHPMAMSGNSVPMVINGNFAPIATTGNSAPVAMSGNSAPMAMNGISAPMAMNGISEPIAMNGNSVPMAMNGNSEPMAMNINSVPMVMNGYFAPMGTNRNSAPIEITGNSVPMRRNGNSVPMGISGNLLMMDIIRDPGPVRVNGNSYINRNLDPRDMNGNSLMMDITRNIEPMKISGNSVTMNINGNSIPTDYKRNPLPPEINTYSMPTGVNRNFKPEENNKNFSPIGMNKIPMTIDINRNPVPLETNQIFIQVESNRNPEPMKISRNPEMRNSGTIDVNKNQVPVQTELNKALIQENNRYFVPEETKRSSVPNDINRNLITTFEISRNAPPTSKLDRDSLVMNSSSNVGNDRKSPSLVDRNSFSMVSNKKITSTTNKPWISTSIFNNNRNSSTTIDNNSNLHQIFTEDQNSQLLLNTKKKSPSIIDINRYTLVVNKDHPTIVHDEWNLPSMMANIRKTPLKAANNIINSTNENTKSTSTPGIDINAPSMKSRPSGIRDQDNNKNVLSKFANVSYPPPKDNFNLQTTMKTSERPPLLSFFSQITQSTVKPNIILAETKTSKASVAVKKKQLPMKEIKNKPFITFDNNRKPASISGKKKNTHGALEITTHSKVVRKNFKRIGSQKEKLLDSFENMNPYTAKIKKLNVENKRTNKQTKTGIRRKAVKTLNTQDFLSQRRNLPPQSVLQKTTKSYPMFLKPQPSLVKHKTLRPKFSTIDKPLKRLAHKMKPKLIMTNRRSGQNTQRVLPKRARVNNVLDMPIRHSTLKPKFINEDMGFMFNNDYMTKTRRPVGDVLDSDFFGDNYNPSASYGRSHVEQLTTEAARKRHQRRTIFFLSPTESYDQGSYE